MARRIRVAVVGCGFFALNHLNGWRDLAAAGAELVGVCDVDQARVAAASQTFAAPAFTDMAAMLQTVKPDVVDIVTQMRSHRELARIAADAGVAAIVQKPFAPTLDDCTAIVETARKAGAFLAVHENFRFQAPMLRVKEVIDSGEIGRPTWGRIAFRTGFDVYRTQPYHATEPRFAILDVGVHVLDLARVFFGEAERISCETQQRRADIAGEDTATMLVRHKSGAVSISEVTYQAQKSPDPFPETLVEIEGESGTVTVEAGLMMTVSTSNSRRCVDVSVPLLPWTAKPWHVAQESVFRTNKHMLEALQAGREADTSGADNLKTFALAEAAYEAATATRAIRPRV